MLTDNGVVTMTVKRLVIEWESKIDAKLGHRREGPTRKARCGGSLIECLKIVQAQAARLLLTRARLEGLR